jgi:hypothetical protein
MARKGKAFTWDEVADVPLSRRENVVVLDDERARVLPKIAAQDELLRDRTRAALVDADVDEAALDEVVSALQGLGRDLDSIKGKMIEAGRRLLRITRAAGARGYRALFRAGLVPISEVTASKLRKVAEAVENGKIPLDLLPAAIRTAYYATTLPPASIDRLIDAGVLRPEVTVREIERFLEIKGEENRDRLLPAERERLMRRLQRVEKTARELRLKLGLASGT